MVSHWANSVNGDIIDIAKLGEIDLSVIPGNGWPSSKLRKAEDYIHDLMEKRILAADVHPEEECLAYDDAQMLAKYGNRQWWDGGDLVARTTNVELSWDGSKLSVKTSEVK